MNKWSQFFLIGIVLFLAQYFFHSLKLLLLISFALGLIFGKEDISFWFFCLIELATLIVLLLLNSLQWIVLEQFSAIFGGISPYLLSVLIFIVSILSVSLLARTGNLLVRRA